MGFCESLCKNPERQKEVLTPNPVNKVDINLIKVCPSVCKIKVQNAMGT